jgi:EAL domain-containing protein (putative c-di-GMP-specific phosphodiesterase class I)
LLVRLRDEDGAILPPGAFLHHAERVGLIRDIDRWMVKRAVQLIAEQLQQGRRVRLDVNLSPKAFTDPRMLTTVREALAESGIPPVLLGVEITETAAATDLVRAQSFIDSLRKLGCRFALDDFGAGFSSFYYLKHLAVDTLKIDGSFVRDLPRSAEDQHLVKAILELARGLELESVAEFVEDEETFRMLGEYGADRAQGYHLAMPRPVEEVLAAWWDDDRCAERPTEDPTKR